MNKPRKGNFLVHVIMWKPTTKAFCCMTHTHSNNNNNNYFWKTNKTKFIFCMQNSSMAGCGNSNQNYANLCWKTAQNFDFIYVCNMTTINPNHGGESWQGV